MSATAIAGETTAPDLSIAPEILKHSWPVRLTHWLMAASILIMIGSGWRIYNASPIFPFCFPEAFTLGGDVEVALTWHNDPGVATAIAWHFAAMWLLAVSYLLFVAWGALSGHFWRDFLPVGPVSFLRDFLAAARFKLEHRLGEYNAVQKVFYWGVLALVLLMLVSGVAIWKPVQTYPLEVAFGGFQGARIVHFLSMAGICGFLLVHIALVALVPKTLVAMVLGQATGPAHAASDVVEAQSEGHPPIEEPPNEEPPTAEPPTTEPPAEQPPRGEPPTEEHQ
jgi:thiosulfate reductase cytochrome b subunit